MTVNVISNAAAKKMQSFVSSVNTDNYEKFVERERETKNKILHFTEKKSTPTVIKALSKKFKDKLNFGEIRASETELVQKFGVTQFPTILALKEPEEFIGERYEGELKVDQLTKFISSYAYQSPKKIAKVEFEELSEKKFKNGSLCNVKKSNLCVIIFTPSDPAASKQLLDTLKPVIETYQQDPVQFTFMQGDVGVANSTKLFNGSQAVIYKPKKAKFLSATTSSANALSE